ncbi:hypothetical protein B0H16DRAFT_1470408 [Mycena metata]|uniref:Uncharacterized protein n=1 Tax=Mycena metata TaxID=1033252 RepID=A0AAD7MQT1_9AGAR|nr:hypothetical protein B0H16DRAFT_1470408 [Mycena metata]
MEEQHLDSNKDLGVKVLAYAFIVTPYDGGEVLRSKILSKKKGKKIYHWSTWIRTRTSEKVLNLPLVSGPCFRVLKIRTLSKRPGKKRLDNYSPEQHLGSNKDLGVKVLAYAFIVTPCASIHHAAVPCLVIMAVGCWKLEHWPKKESADSEEQHPDSNKDLGGAPELEHQPKMEIPVTKKEQYLDSNKDLGVQPTHRGPYRYPSVGCMAWNACATKRKAKKIGHVKGGEQHLDSNKDLGVQPTHRGPYRYPVCINTPYCFL